MDIERVNMSVRLRSCLASVGIKSLEEVFQLKENELLMIPNFGQETLIEILRLKAYYNLDNRNEVEPVQLTFLPTLSENNVDEFSFYDLNRRAFLEYCAFMDERYADIAQNRIWPDDKEPVTLESLGKKYGCTRERIRQLEKKILSNLAKFFCNDSIHFFKESHLHVRLHTSISEKWLSATTEFLEFDEISADQFVDILTRCFGINKFEFSRLALFTASLYSQSINSSIKSQLCDVGLNLISLSSLTYPLLQIKLTDLRLGRLAIKLKDSYEIESLKDLSDSMASLSSNDARKINEYLSDFYSCIEDDDHVDWYQFCSLKGFTLYNSGNVFNSECPYSSTITAIRSLIPYVTTWSNCVEVFDLRTCRSSSERATLRESSIMVLGKENLGPSIARIEKYLLENLSIVLVHRNFNNCHTWVESTLLEVFTKCIDAYDKSDKNFETFKNSVEEQFGNKEDPMGFSHLIWSIINGLPPNRYFHLSNPKKNVSLSVKNSKLLHGKIKLRGFKQIF